MRMARLHLPGHKAHHSDDEVEAREAPAPEEAGPGPDVEREAPDTPTRLPKHAWRGVLKGAVREFKDDELTDRGRLTYYGVL